MKITFLTDKAAPTSMFELSDFCVTGNKPAQKNQFGVQNVEHHSEPGNVIFECLVVNHCLQVVNLI
jgi:hypothetical protein